jgi:hypothetical protein
MSYKKMPLGQRDCRACLISRTLQILELLRTISPEEMLEWGNLYALQ